MRRASLRGAVALALFATMPPGGVLAADKDDDDDDSKPTTPNLYLDLRSYYTKVPAGVLSIGFGNTGSALTQLTSLPNSLSLPASQGVGVDLPLTSDLNDRLTVYGGISGTATQAGTLDWTAFTVTSWNVGFQAVLVQQNGGSFPTVTVQSTLTRVVPDAPFASTNWTNIVEASYAFDKDETRGLLAGAQLTTIRVDTDLATVTPTIIGYVGGYYQWDNNWKFTGRAGVQSFGGADLAGLNVAPAFTGPTVRLDLDKMDDDDNRLFGVTAQIVWAPKPAYQLTLRTPLYLVKN